MFPPGTSVELRKLTWPAKLKATAQFQVLGPDEHGLWVGGLAGNEFRFGDGRVWPADVDSVACLNDVVRWNTLFFPEPRKNLYLDILHTARWVGKTYEYVDLDLDVYGLEELKIVDEEELESNARLNGYPKELVEEAWRSAREGLEIARSGVEPYATVGWKWLESFRASTSF